MRQVYVVKNLQIQFRAYEMARSGKFLQPCGGWLCAPSGPVKVSPPEVVFATDSSAYENMYRT